MLYTSQDQILMKVDQSLPILIYYNFRGQLQPLRNLFCYLEIPFFQIHLQRLAQQTKELPEEILSHFKKFQINKSQLPALIHGDFYVQSLLPVMTYICRRFNRADLLGQNAQIRAKLQQILEIYLLRQPQSMNILFGIAFYATSHSDEELNAFTKQKYEQLLDKSKYIRELCQMIDVGRNFGFVFGKITLIDFFFLETCFYMRGIASSKERVYFERLSEWDPNGHYLSKPNVYYLDIMERFEKMMTRQEFYLKNAEYLQSFSIVNVFMSERVAMGLKQFWLGNQKFVK